MCFPAFDHRQVLRNVWKVIFLCQIATTLQPRKERKLQYNPPISTADLSTFWYIDIFFNSGIFPSRSLLNNLAYIDLFSVHSALSTCFLVKPTNERWAYPLPPPTHSFTAVECAFVAKFAKALWGHSSPLSSLLPFDHACSPSSRHQFPAD